MHMYDSLSLHTQLQCVSVWSSFYTYSYIQKPYFACMHNNFNRLCMKKPASRYLGILSLPYISFEYVRHNCRCVVCMCSLLSRSLHSTIDDERSFAPCRALCAKRKLVWYSVLAYMTSLHIAPQYKSIYSLCYKSQWLCVAS